MRCSPQHGGSTYYRKARHTWMHGQRHPLNTNNTTAARSKLTKLAQQQLPKAELLMQKVTPCEQFLATASDLLNSARTKTTTNTALT